MSHCSCSCITPGTGGMVVNRWMQNKDVGALVVPHSRDTFGGRKKKTKSFWQPLLCGGIGRGGRFKLFKIEG